MRQIIFDFPKQFRLGLKAAENIKLKNKFGAVLVCGMGGSALPADILSIYFEEKKIKTPLFVHKDYGLPGRVNKNHLVVCLSYSGNTEETISAYQEALRKKLPLAAIASGGKLAQLCGQNKTPLAKVPSGLPPRMAINCQFAALAKILSNGGIIPDESKNILNLEKKINPPALEAPGKKLAQKLKGKIPVIYSSLPIRPLAYIWKIKLNESSKIPAFYNSFPELNHNELSSFASRPEKLFVIILKDSKDEPRILKRIGLTADIIKNKGVTVEIIGLEGKDIFYKIFTNIMLADWTSFYLASEYKVNPLSVNLQEEFKKKMQKS